MFEKVISKGNKDFFILFTVIIGFPLRIILKVNFDSSMKAFNRSIILLMSTERQRTDIFSFCGEWSGEGYEVRERPFIMKSCLTREYFHLLEQDMMK